MYFRKTRENPNKTTTFGDMTVYDFSEYDEFYSSNPHLHTHTRIKNYLLCVYACNKINKKLNKYDLGIYYNCFTLNVSRDKRYEYE